MARIRVLAGPNGAGKSSLAGAMFRAAGADYFNPDEAARVIRDHQPALTNEEANSAAWHEGKRALERAIAQRVDFNFETTLGGRSITALLHDAISVGIDVAVWYAALRTPELHIKRVRARVARGGHDITERDIRRRYDTSRLNLIYLLPGLAAVRLFDNSFTADPAAGKRPRPTLVLSAESGQILEHCELGSTPDWAKPILMEAFRIYRRG